MTGLFTNYKIEQKHDIAAVSSPVLKPRLPSGNFFGQVVVVVILTGIFFLFTSTAYKSAQKEAHSQKVFEVVAEVERGLNFFFTDQNHFPSGVEFSNNNLMLNYFNIFPVPELPFKQCSSSLVYTRLSPNKYELNFCLPKKFGSYSSGWNKFIKTQ